MPKKISDRTRESVRRLYFGSGLSIAAVGRRYDISEATAAKIVSDPPRTGEFSSSQYEKIGTKNVTIRS